MATKGFAARTMVWVLGAGALLALSAAPAQAAFPGENGKIAFDSGKPDCGTTQTLEVINPDGTNRTLLNNITGGHPSWSPDGPEIAFESNSEFGGISVMRSDGSSVRRLVPASEYEPPHGPAWSPDGTKIAFSMGGAIHTIDVGGGGLTRLPNSGNGLGHDADPAWSPDGRTIAVARFLAGRSDIFLLAADGSGTTRVTDDPVFDFDPNWSPDASRIAFSKDLGGPIANEEIWVVDRDGSNLTRLTNNNARDLYPAFSPDGTKIVFTRAEHMISPGTNFELFLMNPDGSGATNISNTPNYVRCGAVSEGNPDWQRLPFKNTSKKCKVFPGGYRNHGQCIKASR